MIRIVGCWRHRHRCEAEKYLGVGLLGLDQPDLVPRMVGRPHLNTVMSQSEYLNHERDIVIYFFCDHSTNIRGVPVRPPSLTSQRLGGPGLLMVHHGHWLSVFSEDSA